ncbi:MAG: ribonuclease Z [Clostridia bacterium]|nr:ribonuclease Z [Clostridia bacterium]
MKKITVAVVLDDNEGMLLFGKRQSKDRVMIAEFVSSVGEENIYVSPFSKRIFENYVSVTYADNPIEACVDGGACFIENMPLSPYVDSIETLIIYRWNRLYHSDVKFDLNPEKSGFKLESVSEFQGSSHDRITKEIYRK